MDAVVWSDYLCPWCYLGTDRTARLERLGVRVTPLPYELHPELPPEGRPAGARLRATYERIGALCREAGLPFRVPDRIPNTRRAHETVAWAAEAAPGAVRALHDRLFAAFFAEGRDIGDPDVLDGVVADVGLDARSCRAAVDAGRFADVVVASREQAIDAGAAGAPAWLLDGRVLLPGVQAPEAYDRMVERLRARSA